MKLVRIARDLWDVLAVVDHRIICTSAFTKAETTPQIEIDTARFLARRYREARFRNELVIVESDP